VLPLPKRCHLTSVDDYFPSTLKRRNPAVAGNLWKPGTRLELVTPSLPSKGGLCPSRVNDRSEPRRLLESADGRDEL
jgi:hypothetical protein